MSLHKTLSIGAIVLVLALGCRTNDSRELAPIFNTGASATIIDPGQSAPAMPPMMGSHPGAYGQAPPGSAPPAAGTPGTPGAAAGAPQAGGSRMVMLGGTTTVDTREKQTKQNPLKASPLLWPVYAVAWPFIKISEAVSGGSGKTTRRSSGNPAPAVPPPSATAARRDAQATHEREKLAAMERALQEQAANPPVSAPAPAGATLSIAEELAALRQRGTPTRELLPRDPEREWHSGAPAPSAQPAPRAAAGPADRVEDRDGDGRPDHWMHHSDGRLAREIYDDDGDGRIDRSLFYDPDTELLARAEEDTDADGRVDSWAYYDGGRLTRRRADSNGDGVVDTWTFYRDEVMTRHEEDSNGDGFRDRIDYYEDGRLARRTEDADGDGRPNQTTRFDSAGHPSELEEDRDGDGEIDVRSYYAEGRLVRRELLHPETVSP